MYTVTDSSSRPIRGSNITQRSVAELPPKANKAMQEQGSSHSSVPDALNQQALEAVRESIDNNYQKVSDLKSKIDTGQYTALSVDNQDYWDNLASKVIDIEKNINK